VPTDYRFVCKRSDALIAAIAIEQEGGIVGRCGGGVSKGRYALEFM